MKHAICKWCWMLSAAFTVFLFGLTVFCFGWWALPARWHQAPQKIDWDGRSRFWIEDGTIVCAPYGTYSYDQFQVDQFGPPLTHQKFEVAGLRFQRTTFLNDHLNSFALEMPLLMPAIAMPTVCLFFAISFWLFRRVAIRSKPGAP